jgi:hypothetical protein
MKHASVVIVQIDADGVAISYRSITDMSRLTSYAVVWIRRLA